MPTKIIQRGAEAVLTLQEHKGRKALKKERIRKNYRLPVIDRKIRKQRTKRESNLIDKSKRTGINVPHVFEVGETKIIMEYIEGKTIKSVFNFLSTEDQKKIAEEIGLAVAKLHINDIIHGDLTTSNMVIKKGKIYFIDFGLGKTSKKPEDKATDLYLLLQALRSTHFPYWEQTWHTILNIYKKHNHKSNEILNRFEKIEKRRRYS